MKVVSVIRDSKKVQKGVKVLSKDGSVRVISIPDLEELYDKGLVENTSFTTEGKIKGKLGRLPVELEVPNMAIQQDRRISKNLLLKKPIRVYHGTKEPELKVRYGYGNLRNDYGRGFYTCEDIESAREWSYSNYTPLIGESAYVYGYDVDLEGLNILNMTELPVECWIAILLENRTTMEMFKEKVLRDRREKFISMYSPDMSNVDVIVGYRADDGFFNYILRFLRGYYYVGDMFEIMRSGFLGIQVVFKSEKAIKRLNNVYKEGSPKKYNGKYYDRVSCAIKEIDKMAAKSLGNETIADILRGVVDEI